MNKIVLLILIFIVPSVWAEGFRCMKSARDTRLEIQVQKDQIVMVVTNPSGFDFMPLSDGPLTAFQIPALQTQAQDLKPLGDQFELRWAQSACEVTDLPHWRVTCLQSGLSSLAGIKNLSLRSWQVQEDDGVDRQQSMKYRFILEKDGNFYFLSFQFPQEGCFSL